MSTFDRIHPEKRERFLEELLDIYVDRQGLGAIAKGDLNALIVYLFNKYSISGAYDTFDLSEQLKVSERQVKSLISTGELKYNPLAEGEVWVQILKHIASSDFELESLEQGKVRFKMENPAWIRYLRNWTRKVGGTVSYSVSSEAVSVSLNNFFKVLNRLYDLPRNAHPEGVVDTIKSEIDKVLQQIRDTLGKERIKELREGKLGDVLGKAA